MNTLSRFNVVIEGVLDSLLYKVQNYIETSDFSLLQKMHGVLERFFVSSYFHERLLGLAGVVEIYKGDVSHSLDCVLGVEVFRSILSNLMEYRQKHDRGLALEDSMRQGHSTQDVKRKKALIIKTTSDADRNRAFRPGRELGLYESITKSHQVFLKTIGSIYELEIFVESFKEVPKYDRIILSGHGGVNYVRLGSDFFLSEEKGMPADEQTKIALSLLRRLAAKDSIVVLNSCLTGKGDSNIAQCISRYMNQSTVFSASEETDSKSLSFSKGEPIFKNGIRNITRVYREGVLLSSTEHRRKLDRI